MNANHDQDINRRTFVKNTTIGCISAGMLGQHARAENKGEKETPKIKEYRTLGRTGFQVSDVGLGTLMIPEGVLRFALDAGMNYLDCSPIYRSEETIGKCIKGMDRKKLFITDKFFFRGQSLTKENVIDSFRRSLEKLDCEYIDCYMLQSVPSSEVIKNEAFHEAMRQLKNEEKVRFTGAACHGSEVWIDTYKETMEQIMGTAIEDGRFDVLLFVYNFIQQEQGKRILEACKKNDIGSTIMKSNPIAKIDFAKQIMGMAGKKIEDLTDRQRKLFDKLQSLKEKAAKFEKEYNIKTEKDLHPAALKFILSNPNVGSLLVSAMTYEMLEAGLSQSGQTLSKPEKHSLLDYEKALGPLYCRHACGECESACPRGVPVNTIMRYNHYKTAQGLDAHAKNEYALLSTPNAAACRDCEGYCEEACPYQVPIRQLLAAAHGNLHIA